MKKLRKARYFGVAAAALLAVAPLTATPVATSDSAATVSVAKAATTTYSLNYTAPQTITIGKDTKSYTQSKGVFTQSTTVVKNQTKISASVLGLDTTNWKIGYVGDANGWYAYGDLIGAARTFTLASPIVLYLAGAPVSANAVTADNSGQITAIAYTDANGKTGSAAPSAFTQTSLTVKDPTYAQAGVKAVKGTSAQVYNDQNLTTTVNQKLNDTDVKQVQQVIYNGSSVYAYKIGDGQYVKAADVVTVASFNQVVLPAGSVVYSGASAVKIYSDAELTKDSGTTLAKNSAWATGLSAQDSNGNVIAYAVGKDQWVKASDVTTSNPATSDLTISVLPSGTTVDSGSKAAVVYTDAATTQDSGARLSTSYSTWAANKVAKDKSGNIVAYDLGNNQWVKATDLNQDSSISTPTVDVTVSNTPNPTHVYSNYGAAAIYSDPETTQATGNLSTSVNEWAAWRQAKDANGNIVAYDLGKNQWVKASDLSRTYPLKGIFYSPAGVKLYDLDGNVKGTIKASGGFKVYAVGYVSGMQVVKLGDNNQWAPANAGDYEP